jgi:sugar-specific transcriptional regulator TrmB
MEVDELSLERIIEALVSLGFSQTDAELYIYIATKGPETARKISDSLSINSRQTHCSLKRLQNKGIVMKNNEVPSEFSALPFERVLEVLLEIKNKQAKSLEENKAELISDFLTEKEKS